MIEWFNSLLGEAIGTYAAIGVGLLIVIVLIIILLRILRSFSGGMFGNKSLNRLGVIEAAAVDNKRRLVLVRRDNVEHLIMIGGTSDILVEAGINRSATPSRAGMTPAPQAAPANIVPTHAPKSPTPANPAPAASTPAAPTATAPATKPAPTQSAAPQAAAPRPQAPVTPTQQAPAPKPAVAANPQQAPAVAPSQATVPTKTTAPVITPPTDSAKVGDDMDRLLNQIAGDAKG